MKALPKRKGNQNDIQALTGDDAPSMKALPKRKGNSTARASTFTVTRTLNESPSEKEGKFAGGPGTSAHYVPSMKALPKRKGN